MQMFSGLDSDGMRDEGDGSFLEVSAVRTFTEAIYGSKAEKLGAAFLNFHPQFVKNGNRRVPRFGMTLRGHRRRAPARSRRPRTWPEPKLPHVVPYQVQHSAPRWERLHNRRNRSGVGKKGRWKARSSLDRYEESAMGTQVYRRIPADQRAFCESCARELMGVMMRTCLPVPTPC